MLAPIKLACQVLSGKKPPAIEEACEALSGKEPVKDQDVYLPLIMSEAAGSGAFVRHLGLDPNAALAESVSDFLASSRTLEAVAMAPPVTIEISVPSGNVEPGQEFQAQGPHGAIKVRLPQDATPGDKLLFQLAPKAEYRIQVPAGAAPGWAIRFDNQVGEEVKVLVPEGYQPGDTFEVAPPALMVRVPDKAKPGDVVMFSHMVSGDASNDGRGGRTEFFRATVPPGLQPTEYFTALLPAPGRSLDRLV